MSHPHVKKWYHQWGPLNWYRGEWIRFEFEAFGRTFAMIWLRTASQFVWIFGSKVVQRAEFNRPICVKGGLHFTL